LGAGGTGNVVRVVRTWRPGGSIASPLGQLLVIMGAVLGAALGVSLALIVEHAETGRAVLWDDI
jgi:uncharacterized protein involved in exopolysaccharide biosynthesis